MISQTEPNPEDYDDPDDFRADWQEWAVEYPWLARKAQAARMEP